MICETFQVMLSERGMLPERAALVSDAGTFKTSTACPSVVLTNVALASDRPILEDFQAVNSLKIMFEPFKRTQARSTCK